MKTNIKLNHINLTVTDVASSSRFFEEYFDFKLIETKGDNLMVVLQGADGFTLVLMAATFNRNGNNSYPDAFHVGFLVDNRQQVTDVYNRLVESGFAAENAPGNMRGGYGFYFNAPGNVLTEVTSYA